MQYALCCGIIIGLILSKLSKEKFNINYDVVKQNAIPETACLADSSKSSSHSFDVGTLDKQSRAPSETCSSSTNKSSI